MALISTGGGSNLINKHWSQLVCEVTAGLNEAEGADAAVLLFTTRWGLSIKLTKDQLQKGSKIFHKLKLESGSLFVFSGNKTSFLHWFIN